MKLIDENAEGLKPEVKTQMSIELAMRMGKLTTNLEKELKKEDGVKNGDEKAFGKTVDEAEKFISSMNSDISRLKGVTSVEFKDAKAVLRWLTHLTGNGK